MNLNNRVIQKIDSKYVGDECIQMMMAYRKYLGLIGNGEVLYHDQANYELINKYLEDERRSQFPYSNIPTHVKRVGFRKFKVANQLLNFDTPYFRFSSEFSGICYAVKDDKNAYLVNDVLIPLQPRVTYFTREELEKLFDKKEGQLQLVLYNNKWGHSLIIPTQEEILESFKKDVINIYIESQNGYNAKKVLTSIVNNASSDSIIQDYQFCSDDILVVNSKGKDLSVSIVSLRYMNENCFKVISKDIPINKYTLEQIKSFSDKIILSIEPKIKLSLNPNITPKDIEDGKKMVKTIGGMYEATGE